MRFFVLLIPLFLDQNRMPHVESRMWNATTRCVSDQSLSIKKNRIVIPFEYGLQINKKKDIFIHKSNIY